MAELNATATQVTPALPNLWFSTINYFALCVVNGIGMAFVLGGSVLRIGEARLAGRIGGTIIALVIGGDALALYLNMDRIWDVNVPALEIARTIHPWFAFVYTLIIFALIYNTVFSLFSRRRAVSRVARQSVCASCSWASLRSDTRRRSWASRS